MGKTKHKAARSRAPIDPGTIDQACEIIGGKAKPINKVTFYRGVKAGRYTGPFHPSPGISRVDLNKTREDVRRLAQSSEAE